MKTGKKILIAIPIAIIIVYLCLPFYAKKALIHWFPTIDDLGIFEHATVHAPDSCWEWAVSEDYNSFHLSKEDSAYIDDMKTVSFLVIKNDSILYETYRGGWNDTLTGQNRQCGR